METAAPEPNKLQLVLREALSNLNATAQTPASNGTQQHETNVGVLLVCKLACKDRVGLGQNLSGLLPRCPTGHQPSKLSVTDTWVSNERAVVANPLCNRTRVQGVGDCLHGLDGCCVRRLGGRSPHLVVFAFSWQTTAT